MIVRIRMESTFVKDVEVSESELRRYESVEDWYYDCLDKIDPRTSITWEDEVESDTDLEVRSNRIQSRNSRRR